jgi:hypothetical protein
VPGTNTLAYFPTNIDVKLKKILIPNHLAKSPLLERHLSERQFADSLLICHLAKSQCGKSCHLAKRQWGQRSHLAKHKLIYPNLT